MAFKYQHKACKSLTTNVSCVCVFFFPEGPLNVILTPPTQIASGVASTFVCSALCYPSCAYDWLIDGQLTAGSSGSRVLQYTPPADTMSATIVCKVHNLLSGLFAESSVTVRVDGKGTHSDSVDSLLSLFEWKVLKMSSIHSNNNTNLIILNNNTNLIILIIPPS